jgi:hypothetical protein
MITSLETRAWSPVDDGFVETYHLIRKMCQGDTSA